MPIPFARPESRSAEPSRLVNFGCKALPAHGGMLNDMVYNSTSIVLDDRKGEKYMALGGTAKC
jgi:hypothetical protein